MRPAMQALLVALVAGLAGMTAAPAVAEGYVGGGLGWAHLGVDCSGTVGCDRSDTGGRLYGGYSIEPPFGVEFGYVDWGRARASAGLGDLAHGRLHATGIGLALALRAPLGGDWSGSLRAGVLQNRGQMIFDGFGSVSKDSFQPHLGLGLGLKIARRLTLTGDADFSRVRWGTDAASTTDRLQLLSIGLRYDF